MLVTGYPFQKCKDTYKAHKLWRRLIQNEILSIESEYSLKTRVWNKIKHFNYRNEYSDKISNKLKAVKRVLDRSVPLWDRPIKDISLVISQSTLWSFEGALLFRAIVENMEINIHNLSICRVALLGRFDTNKASEATTTVHTLPIVLGLAGRQYVSTLNTEKLYNSIADAMPEYSIFYELSILGSLFDIAKDNYESKCLYIDKSLLNFEEITHQCLLKNVFLSKHEQFRWLDMKRYTSKENIEFIHKYGTKFLENFDNIFKESNAQREVLALLWLSLTQFINDIHTDVQRHDTTMANSYIVLKNFVKQIELLVTHHFPGDLNELNLLLSLNEPEAKMAFAAYKYNHNNKITMDTAVGLPMFE